MKRYRIWESKELGESAGGVYSEMLNKHGRILNLILKNGSYINPWTLSSNDGTL